MRARGTAASAVARKLLRFIMNPLRDQLGDNLRADLRELLEAAAVEVGQLGVIEAEHAQNRAMNVPDGMRYLHGFLAGLVGCSHDVASLDAAAGEPHRHRCGIVVAAPRLAASANSVIG